MLIWWSVMVVIGAINFCLVWTIFIRTRRQDSQYTPEHRRFVRWAQMLGVIFVSVAFYRTIFVSSYPSRLAWFDTMLNSPFVIRSLALFAELSFITLIALIFLHMPQLDGGANKRSGFHAYLSKAPIIAVVCIFAAQFSSFGGLITQYNFLFAIEETLWALAFISLTPLVIARLRQNSHSTAVNNKYRIFLIVMAVWCAGYLAFQCFYALPFMYYAHLADGLHSIVFAEALRQAIFDFTATQNYSTWGGLGFFIWQSGYFSICSWMVLYFMTVPPSQIMPAASRNPLRP